VALNRIDLSVDIAKCCNAACSIEHAAFGVLIIAEALPDCCPAFFASRACRIPSLKDNYLLEYCGEGGNGLRSVFCHDRVVHGDCHLAATLCG